MNGTRTPAARRLARALSIGLCLGAAAPGLAIAGTPAEPPPASRGCTLLVTLSNEPFVDETDIPEIALTFDARATASDRSLGFFKVGFAVPDVDLVANRVESTTGERPRVVEGAAHGIRILQLRDPDGNRIQFASPLGRR